MSYATPDRTQALPSAQYAPPQPPLSRHAAGPSAGSRHSPFLPKHPKLGKAKILYDAADLLELLRLDVALPPAASHDSGGEGGRLGREISLLRTVCAPSRPWLSSFFADLAPDYRQASGGCVLCKDKRVHRSACCIVA